MERTVEQAMQLLSRYRHDLMNDVQLIKGYLQLGKQERVADIIAKIVSDNARYSRIASYPSNLAFLIMKAELVHPYICIDVDTVPENRTAYTEQWWEQWLEWFIDVLPYLQKVESSPLILTLEFSQKKQRTAVILRVSGTLQDGENIYRRLQHQAQKEWGVELAQSMMIFYIESGDKSDVRRYSENIR